MNLEICKRKCGIHAIMFHGYSASCPADVFDKNFNMKIDLPCQKYAPRFYPRTGHAWYDFEGNMLHGITVERKPGIDLKVSSLYFDGEAQTKCFHAGKDCPFYVEHLLFDEN